MNHNKKLFKVFKAIKNSQLDVVEKMLAPRKFLMFKKTPKFCVNSADEKGVTALMLAAVKGHKGIAELLIVKGADVNSADESGLTSLLLAVGRGHKEIAELLIAKGADVNMGIGNGETPLMLASEKGYKEIAELLIAKGAGVNMADEKGDTALIVAIDQGHKEIAELLIAKGGDMNIANKKGNTALTLAISFNRKKISKFLIAKGAGVNMADEKGDTALIVAINQGHKEIAELLIAKGADVNMADKKGDTALIVAINQGHKEIAELLIAKGADVNMADEKGDTALIVATNQGHKEIAELLIAKGADVNVANENGNTVFTLATNQGHKEIAELLIAKGADVNVANKYGQTAFISAAYQGFRKIVELLIAKGVDVNAANKYGETALTLASNQGHKEIAELLIAKGADVNSADEWGSTALMWAVSGNQRIVVKELIAKGADLNVVNKKGNTALMLAIEGGDTKIEVADLLIANGADLNVVNKKGNTALMLAIEGGDTKIEVADLLIANGADLNVTNKKGNTALIVAVERYCKKIPELLIAKGADLNVVNKKGNTALIVAVERKCKKIIELLIAKGADLNVVNKKGRTALMLASERGQKKIAELLITKRANVYITNEKGKNARMLALDNGHIKIAQFINANGGGVNFFNKKGKTVLMVAESQGHKKNAALLITKGANVDVSNDKGNNTLTWESMTTNSEIDPFIIKCFSINYKELEDDRWFSHFKELPKIDQLLSNGELERSLKFCLKGLKSYPDSFLFYQRASDIYKELGQGAKSAKILIEGLEKSLSKCSLCGKLADIAFEKKLYRPAISWWIRACFLQCEADLFVDFKPFLNLAYVCQPFGFNKAEKFFLNLADRASSQGPIRYNSEGAELRHEVARELMKADDNITQFAIQLLYDLFKNKKVNMSFWKRLFGNRRPDIQQVTKTIPTTSAESVLETPSGGAAGKGSSDVEALIILLDSPVWDVRYEAIASLGKLKMREAIIPIVECVGKEKNFRVRGAGLRVLKEVFHCLDDRMLAQVQDSWDANGIDPNDLNSGFEDTHTPDEVEHRAFDESHGGTIEQFYAAMSREIIERHGPLIKVDYVSHFPKFEIWFFYEDGTTICSGQRRGRLDINFLSLGYVGEGPRYAQSFLEAAGATLTSEDIKSIEPGTSIQLSGGQVRIVRKEDQLSETESDPVKFVREVEKIGAIYRLYNSPDEQSAKAFMAKQNITAQSFFVVVKIADCYLGKDRQMEFDASGLVKNLNLSW